VVSEVLTAFITINTLMMEAVSTSEISDNFYDTTWYNIPQDSHDYKSKLVNDNYKLSHKKPLSLLHSAALVNLLKHIHVYSNIYIIKS
jgi:hypothetical protein